MKTIIGLIEEVTIIGTHEKKVKARIDTGAARSSIDIELAKELGIGPVIKKVRVRSATGREVREIVKATMCIADRKIKASFTLADRKHMDYDVLIGRSILKKGFLIDTQKQEGSSS